MFPARARDACLRHLCSAISRAEGCRPGAAAVTQPIRPPTATNLLDAHSSESSVSSRNFHPNPCPACGLPGTFASGGAVGPSGLRGVRSPTHIRHPSSASAAALWNRPFSSSPPEGGPTQPSSTDPDSKDRAEDPSFFDNTLEFHKPEGTAGETTWKFIWDGEEEGDDREEDLEVWECDFTGGAIPHNNVNALLSNKAKWEIHDSFKDDPIQFNTAYLADKYRIREQRVMAIIALKEMETAAIKDGKFTRDEVDLLQEEVDAATGSTYSEGVGERAYPHIPTFPKFEYITREEAAQDGPDFDAVEVLRAKMAEKHEARAIQEFKERLDYNMMRVGKSLQRKPTRKKETHVGVGGQPLLIKPLGKESKAKGLMPWVATPDGKTRSTNEDEDLLLKRLTPKPRRRVLW